MDQRDRAAFTAALITEKEPIMGPSELAETLRQAATTADLTVAALRGSNDRIGALERELASRPTTWAYEAACKALHHWRDEAARLAKLVGVEPRQMDHR